MPLSLVLNGETRCFEDLEPHSTVERLVSALGLQADRVAIERNGDIVSRRLWPQTPLAEGDRIEMVHFVGGGAGR